jgi:hypothetical protein
MVAIGGFILLAAPDEDDVDIALNQSCPRHVDA